MHWNVNICIKMPIKVVNKLSIKDIEKYFFKSDTNQHDRETKADKFT